MSGQLTKASYPTAKDIDGNPTLICLDAEGRVPVTSEAPGICFHTPFNCIALTSAGDPLASDTLDVGEVTINAAKQYNCFEWSVSSNVDVIWTIVYIDDADGTPAETTVHQFITNPAAPNFCCKLACLDLDTTGGTGTQKLVLRAEAIDPSCLGPALGLLAVKEQA